MLFAHRRAASRRDVLKAAAAGLLAGSWSSSARAQAISPLVDRSRETIQRWLIGMEVVAQGGPCRNLIATLPVPLEWPEQDAKLLEDDTTPNVRPLEFRDVPGGGARQVIVQIPLLQAGEEAQVHLKYEVRKWPLVAPQEVSQFAIPRGLPRDFGPYLGPSPYIETTHRRIREAARQAAAGKEGGWETARAIYDWVRANVRYKEGPIKGAAAALADGEGDCEELTSLVIALCRVNRIPARTVWVPGHCYPEFYLVDQENQGHWFPCQAAGDPAFGEMNEPRPILQKGDNFKVPERRNKVRYVSEFLTGSGGSPRVTWLRREINQ